MSPEAERLLTPAELDLMRVVWARGPSTVILRVGERELQGTLVELTQDGQARGMGRRMRR